MKHCRTTLTCLAGLALILLSASPAAADATGITGQEGIKTDVTKVGLDRASGHRDIKTGAADVRRYEYETVSACTFNTHGVTESDSMCLNAIQACAGNTPAQGEGPQARIHRRQVDANGVAITSWQTIATTCFPELGPGKQVPGKPVLGLGQILAAFHTTPWAKPNVHIQPEGNVTLVTLPTYFEVRWPTAGFQPGEIDNTTLLGYQVRIRPTVQGYNYIFGDGTTYGPTTSTGGPYPNSDVIHDYPKAGSYQSHIEITYGGEFSVGGGPWIPIPDLVTITGGRQTITVKTAQARLVIR